MGGAALLLHALHGKPNLGGAAPPCSRLPPQPSRLCHLSPGCAASCREAGPLPAPPTPCPRRSPAPWPRRPNPAAAPSQPWPGCSLRSLGRAASSPGGLGRAAAPWGGIFSASAVGRDVYGQRTGRRLLWRAHQSMGRRSGLGLLWRWARRCSRHLVARTIRLVAGEEHANRQGVEGEMRQCRRGRRVGQVHQTGQGERGRILVLYGRLPRPRGHQSRVCVRAVTSARKYRTPRPRLHSHPDVAPRPGSMRRLPTKRSSLYKVSMYLLPSRSASRGRRGWCW